jgi:hypothetical protein
MFSLFLDIAFEDPFKLICLSIKDVHRERQKYQDSFEVSLQPLQQLLNAVLQHVSITLQKQQQLYVKFYLYVQ